ncbi:MAG TPA: hypothetical protein VHE35_29675 [Kofleriaceae bacterium]|nr:hypothetical protein [Kofleriaceae bacterium]
MPALAVVAALAACRGAAADEPDVTVRVASELTVAQGEAAALSVTVAPAAGRTVSADGPLRLSVDADDGVALARRRYGRKDAADPAADAPRFDVRLRGKTAGDHALALEVRLWLCGAKLCRPVRLTRTVTVHVTAPPADAGPDAPPVDAGVPPPDAGRRRRPR